MHPSQDAAALSLKGLTVGRSVAQPGSALASGARGREFESPRSDHHLRRAGASLFIGAARLLAPLMRPGGTAAAVAVQCAASVAQARGQARPVPVIGSVDSRRRSHMRVGERAGAGLAPLRLAHVRFLVPGGLAVLHVGALSSLAFALSTTREAIWIATGAAVRIGLVGQSRCRRIGRRAVAANLRRAGAVSADARRSRRDGGAGRRLQGTLSRRFEGVAARIGRA